MSSGPKSASDPATTEPASGLVLGAWGRAVSSTSSAPVPRPAASTSAVGSLSYRTPAEASGWTRTSTAAETIAYVEAVAAGSLPHAGRLALSQYGTSEEGRPLTLVTVSDPPIVHSSLADLKASSKLRVHVNANIHAGEVEGKECVQQLLREFAAGDHSELLEHAIVVFSINCNPDGALLPLIGDDCLQTLHAAHC
jgi:murein tripeptide amidase MpaA